MSRMSARDSVLLSRVKGIIEQRGWPGRHLVADDGAHSAWLIVQHAPVAYQREALVLLQHAVEAGDARPADEALLEDAVLAADGQPERYGSHLPFGEAGRPYTIPPILDEVCADKRRAAVGLEPLADYLARFGVAYQPAQGACPL